MRARILHLRCEKRLHVSKISTLDAFGLTHFSRTPIFFGELDVSEQEIEMEIRLSSPYRSELRHRGSPVWTWSLSEHAAKWAIAIFHSIQSHLEHYLTSSLTETSLVWRNELLLHPFPTWKHDRSRKVLRKLIWIRIWAAYGVPLNTQLTTLMKLDEPFFLFEQRCERRRST